MPRAAQPAANKLINRQVVGTYQGKLHQRRSGLLKSLPEGDAPPPEPSLSGEIPPESVNRIAPSLRQAGLVVPIDSLTPDPLNARLHPENNVEAIRLSLRKFGQRKTISVILRDGARVVMAGNGTMEAARLEGWTEIAAAVDDDLGEIDAIGYGLADNKSAELARWDFEVTAQLDEMLQEAGESPVGWDADMLKVLRKQNFVEPPVDFKEVGEDIETDHQCPKCGYVFSGGKTVERNGDATS